MTHQLSTSKGDIIIRLALPADGLALRELRLEALAAHPDAFAADIETTVKEEPAVWSVRIAEYATDRSGAICIAQAGDILVGMTGIGRGHWPKTRHFGKIWGVYVKPDWRGIYLGDELVNSCVDWARNNGISVVNLGVNIANISAIRCYSRCGFTIYGIEPRAIYINGVYHDELLMVRLL